MSRAVVRRGFAFLLLLASAATATAQAPLRKIGEMELRLIGVSATVDPARPVVPKNIPAAVRIVVRSGPSELSLADALRFLGPGVEVKGELSGPGLAQTVTLPIRAPEDPLPADPLLLPLPGLTVSGNYTLANLRIESGGRSVLDVTPSTVTIEVVEQVLVTSVKTRALTMDEIREKGIVLDSDDYLGFEFTLGLKLESQPVNFSFPVVFDRQGVKVPDPLSPPAVPSRQGVPMPTLVPLLLEPEPPPDDGTGGGPRPRVAIVLPSGEPVRIPAVLVIPGNVGYLKQFFSAQLFVANGAPAGSGLALRDVSGTVKLPPGADLELGTDDDPLALPETVRGPQPETLPVLGLGPDGKIGTGDDDERFAPGEQGEAEFLLRGEREGFHSLEFDIAATLEGLASGPVGIKGKASGGVLVRNPFFDMTFTVPATVRQGETFKLYTSVVNIGQGLANDVTVSLDAAAISGCRLLSDASVHVDTIAPGDSATVAFEFESQRTGQVVASYLKLEGPGQSGGTLRFSLGVGERGVPLSPDTLVLPAAVDAVPDPVVNAAMRVLGQAWSVANAPSGTLPRGVLRTSKAVVVAKALALAEAGLRISLGQDVSDSLAALDYDFFAGSPTDPGFVQILRDTEAGRSLRQVFGGPAPTEEPVSSGGPRLAAAAVIGPEVLSGAGPFGLHAVLVFDRLLDPDSAAQTARYQVPDNVVRSAKAVLSGRLVVVSLEKPEGPYVPTTVSVAGLMNRAGRHGNGTAELTSRLVDAGAVVSGRVIAADGAPVATASVVYTNNTDLTCQRVNQTGLASHRVAGDGRFEYRYVRRDACGMPFEMVTADPDSGAQRKSTGFVRAAGERIVLDIVLLGRGAVEGTVRDLQTRPVAGATVVALSQSDNQSGGQAVTDALGRYRIDGITVGPVSVKAGKGVVVGHSSGRIDRAGTAATVDVVLDGGAVRVSGTVRLENGVESTVPGVYVVYNLDPPPNATTVGFVRSGPDGRFQFVDMPAGATQLHARLDTGETASTALFTTAAGDNLTGKDLLFDIAPPAQTGSVAGVVLLPDNSPAAQAIVTVGPRGVRADDQGAFRIDGISVQPNQAQRVDARSRDGRRSGYSTFLLNTAGSVAPAVIRLSGIGTVRFTVLDPAGAPLASQEVAVMKACGNPCGCDSRLTDATGQVSWEGASVGLFQVQAIREIGGHYEAAVGTASVVRDGETAFGVLQFLGTGTVSGIVLDPSTAEGRPSFGADVSLSSRHFVYDPSQFICGMIDGPSHSARTGIDGRFRFTGVGMGTVRLGARQEFYPNPVAATGQLVHDGQVLEIPLRLISTTAGVLSGTVYLPDGVTPAGRGVQVTAYGALPDVVVETNDQGRFRFARIFPQGSYRLTVSDPATGGLAQTQVYLQAGQDLVNDVRLKGRGTVRVSVVDGLNLPVDNAYVKLQETEFPRRSYEGAIGPANQGLVVFEGVYEGPFSVEAADIFARGGRASGSVPREGEVVDVKVRVSATGTVRGRFLRPDRTTPIPNGVVKLVVGGRTIGQITTTSAGEVGRFSFDYVPAGPVRLEAEDPLTGRTGIAAGSIEDEGQILVLDVYAQAIGRVQGLVTSNGAVQPLAFVDVASGSFRAATQTDADGRYLVEGVPEGQITVSASLAAGFLKGTAVGSLQGEGSSLDLDVSLRGSGRLTGQVFAADRLTPGPTSQVQVHVWGQGGASLSTVTGDEGRFVFDRVPAGQALVQADVVSSVDGASASVMVPEAGDAEVQLFLNGLGHVRGVAKDSAGHPTAGTVSINGPKAGLTVTVGMSGLFEVRDLPAGPYTATLRVSNEGIQLFGTASFEVRPEETADVSLQVQPSGSVTGTVLRPDSATPAYGTQVTLRVSATGAQLVTQAREDGRFDFRGVPLGAFTLSAHDPITAGLAVLSGRSVLANGELVDVGALILDAAAPTLQPIEPVPGSVRAALAGPLVIDVADQGIGIDNATLIMILPGGVAAAPFTFAGGRASTMLRADLLAIGENRLVAQVKDRAGNVSSTEWRFTATGGVLRGMVQRPDGSLGSGVPLRLDATDKPPSDPSGAFVFTGVRPGLHTIYATDPDTGLVSYIQATLGDGEDRTLVEPLRLPAFGRITGVVRRPDSNPAPGVTVTVTSRSAISGPNGEFDLGMFPLGSYALSATGADGDRGQATATLVTLGAPVFVPITLNGVGAVSVTLRDSASALVVGAAVTVQSSSPFAATLGGTTGPDGRAHFATVFAGTVTARATHPTNGLTGEATGVLVPGGSLEVAVNIQPAGRIAGTVFRREGGTAAGVEVRLTLPRNQTRTTAPDGTFSFEDVPLGSWALTVTDSSTGDVGQASGTLATPGDIANGNVTLNGVGTVRVSVRDASTTPVPGAAVNVTSSAGGGQNGTTDASGVVTFANVLAGAITATGFHPTNGTRGTATGSLSAAGSLDLFPTLQATGTLRGRVLAPDGQTPVSGAVVSATGPNVTTGPTGEFEFADVPVGSYTLSAVVGGRLRARATVALATNDEVVTRDLVLAGAALVYGQVSFPSGAAAPGAQVTVYSPVSLYGGYFTATTNAAGTYEVPDVPVGPFVIAATKGPDRADRTGSVAANGAPVQVDLTLLPSAIALPTPLYNGNQFLWQLAKDGSLSHGVVSAAPEHAGRLELVRDGAVLAFVGPACPTGQTCAAATEEDKQEVVLSEPGLHGLDAVRKVYVARDGYFARQLDVIRNPGLLPVTVDVRITSHFGASSVVTSSTGDSGHTAADRWLTVDDSSTVDPYDTGSPYWVFWPVGVTTWGSGGQGPSTVSTTVAGDGSRLVIETWSSVSLGPGETFALLRFYAAQTDRERARASAERLSELPPEVLVGLTPEEATAVRNFQVPANLISALAPLPPNDGVVTGRVTAGDTQTSAGAQPITFQSQSPFFGRKLVFASGSTGEFQIQGTPSPVVLVPRAPFALTSTANHFPELTATASGDFPLDGQGRPVPSATADLAYAGSGALDLVVTRTDASPVANTNVYLRKAGGPNLLKATNAAGFAGFSPMPGGAYTASVSLFGGPEIDVPVTVVADQRVTVPVVLPGLGRVAGVVRTAALNAIGARVSINGPGFTRVAYADTVTGFYELTDVPFGTYTVAAEDIHRSGAWARLPVTVSGTPSSVDLVLPPVGRVNLTVRVGSTTGPVLPGASLFLIAASLDPDTLFQGVTDSIGRKIMAFVPGPEFRVRGHYPGVTASSAETPLTSIGEAETRDLTLVVPGVGTVNGTLRSRDGLPLPGFVITASSPDGSTSFQTVVSNAAGAFNLTGVPVSPFRLRAECPTIFGSWLYARADVHGTVSLHGDSLALDALCPFGSITPARRRDFWTFSAETGQVVSLMLVPGQAGTPLADPSLEVYGPDGALVAANNDRSTVDKASEVDFTAVSAGEYVVVARASGPEIGSYRLGDYSSTSVPSLRPLEPPRVVGVVKKDWDQANVAGQVLRLRSGASVVETTASAGDGTFSLGVFPLGDFTLEAVDPEGIAVARASGSASTPGTNVAQDLVVPARGTVTVAVRRGPQLLSAVPVTLTGDHVGALDEDRIRTRPTATNGTVSTTLPAGSVTARVTDPLYGGTYQATGTLADGGSLSLELVLPEAVSRVFGIVTSGDGTVPLPGATVTLVGPASFNGTTDAAGRYEFPTVPPGTYALSAALGGGTVGQAITLVGGDRQADLRLAIPIVKGRITEADGTSPALARVELCQGLLCVARDTAADGFYSFLGGLPAWTPNAYVFLRTWPHDNPSLTSGANFLNTGLPGVVTLNVSLQASRVVYGVVRDADLNPVVAEVRLANPFSTTPFTQTTGPGGTYRFAHVVPWGQVQVTALSIPDGLPAYASSDVMDVDVELDLTLPRAATLSGRLVDSVGEGLGSRTVRFEALETVGEYGFAPWTRDIVVDGEGRFAVVVPTGPFHAIHEEGVCIGDEDQRAALAVADGTLQAGANPELELRVGRGAYYPTLLRGPLGAYGRAQWGAYDSCQPEGEGSLVAAVPEDVRPAAYGRLAADERRVTSLLSRVRGVEVRREQFVPTSGAFVRTIVWLTNLGSEPATLDVELRAELGRRTGWTLQEESSGDGAFGTDDSWAWASVDESLDSPARGAGAVLGQGASLAAFGPGYQGEVLDPGVFQADYSVTVPAGQRVGLMGFAVNRDVNHGTVGALRALADLSEPEALDGLSETDRQQIVNFDLLAPPNAATGLAGVVTQEGEAVPGATVAALGAAGAVTGYTKADSGGFYAIRGLVAGEVRVVAIDPATNRPGDTTATVTDQSLATANVALLAESALGAVQGSVVMEYFGPMSYWPLVVTSDIFAPVWTARTTTDEAGIFSVTAPSGVIRARLLQEHYTNHQLDGVLEPGASLTLDFLVFGQ